MKTASVLPFEGARSEQTLLEARRAGDVDAGEELLERHFAALYRQGR